LLLKRHRITAAATITLATGLPLLAHGLIASNVARTTGGACLTSCALLLLSLHAIRTWVTDTCQERRRLAAATRDADAERDRYRAAEFALAGEQARMRRDAASAMRRNEAALAEELAALRAQFEEERNELVSQTFETAFRLLKGGVMDSPPAEDRVIPFPSQGHPVEGETVRNRGVTRP
jgi:hypothetical protein